MDDQSPMATISVLGPFFSIDHHAPHAVPDGRWQPLSELLQPDGVRERTSQVRDALAASVRCEVAEVPRRVAASVAHLGLAARLVSPQLGALLTGVGDLDLAPAQTWWQPVVGGPVPLSVSRGSLGRHPAGSVDAGVIVEGVVRTLTELFAAQSVSFRVLWGNVASALNGAYSAVVSSRPDLVEAARSLTVGALDHPLLAGMSRGRPGEDFRRTNCCLIYRLGPLAQDRDARQVCGDCVLRSASPD